MHELVPDDVEKVAAEVETNGFAIIESAIDEDFREEICAEIERLEEVRPGGDIPPAPFSGYVTRRWFDLLNDGDVWQRVAVLPSVLAVIEKVLGDGFLLSTMGTAVVGSGEKAQPIHCDDQVYSFPRPHPNLVCNTMWALSDFTVETGATRLVRGSNRFDQDPDIATSYETVPLEMPAGSIGFVVGSCYHGAGANTSGRDRLALTINYCSGSMRQQENLMLGVHPGRMMSFDPVLQDILGFKICKGAGHLFAQDPRLEMERHYGELSGADRYLDQRNGLHAERTSSPDPATS